MEQLSQTLIERYEKYINIFFENNARELQKIVNKIFYKGYGGIKRYNMDEFYSVATDAFVDIIKNDRYNESLGDFKGYLYMAINKAIMDEFKKRNTLKRNNYVEVKEKNAAGEIVKERVIIPDVRIDAPIKEGECETFADIIKSEYILENDIFEKMKCFQSEKIAEYMSGLSEQQKKIADLIMIGCSYDEIKEKLCLTDKQFSISLTGMKSYENKRILREEGKDMEEKDMCVLIDDTSEKFKNTSYSIKSISKQLKNRRIKDNHILQRHSGQWQPFAKSELVSDILRGKSLTQIIISEEIKNGVRMQWLIDGKQRCTTLDDFLNDEFAISKNVRNYNIRYQVVKLDEEGNEVLNDEGFPITEFKDFDIRKKKFSQLPEELQDIFKDRQIPVLYNMNCTKKDIAEDIARFNRSRPMNKAQNGWLGLDEYFAEFVENIAKMEFFKPDFAGSSYTNNNYTSGAIRRIIVEGIMVSYFIEDFRSFDKMCEYLTEEAGDSNFTEFYSYIDRLTAVCNEDVAKLFDAKDSFIWFGLFSRFADLGIDDKKFVDFLMEFDRSLKDKKINGVSYEEVCVNKETGKTRATKDKSVVMAKMNILEKLMYEFLNVDNDDLSEVDILEFVKENVNPDITSEDIEFHDANLESWTVGISDDSRIKDERNKPSMIAVAAYAFENDDSCDDETMIEWFADYENRNKNYILNQKENYLHMKHDLENYISKEEAA